MANTIVTLSGDDAELYKAFQRILDSQKKVDEGYDKIRAASRRAAKEAEAAAKDEAREIERRKQSMRDLGDSVVSMATAYFGVSAALAKVNEGIQLQVDRSREALDIQRQLAAAQQEAAKNLAGKTPAEISKTLQEKVPAIARAASFADFNAITTALGAASSIVGEESALGVVEQSARLTRFTPGELQTTATATADLLKTTGLSDARQALALLASTGSVARPEQLAKLATGAVVASDAAISGATQQDRVAAAREGVALYASLSKIDPQGQSSANATGQLISQVAALFNDPKAMRERGEAVDRLKESIQVAAVAIEQAQERAKRAEAKGDTLTVADAGADRNRIAGQIARDSAELKRLQELQAGAATDPGTFAGRLAAIRANPALSSQLNETLTGETKFLPLFRQLIQGGNEFSSAFDTALKTISTDVRAFEQVADSVLTTPQSQIVAAENRAQVARNVAKVGDIGTSSREAMIGIAVDALRTTSFDFQTTVGTIGQQAILPQVRMFNSDPTAFPNQVLLERLEYMRDVNAPADPIAVVTEALASIQTLARLPETLEALQRIGVDQAKFLAEQNEILRRTERLLGAPQGMGSPSPAAVRAQSQMPSVTGSDWGGSGLGQTGGSW